MCLSSKSRMRKNNLPLIWMGGGSDCILNNNPHCQTLDGSYEENTVGWVNNALSSVLCGFSKYSKLIISVKGTWIFFLLKTKVHGDSSVNWHYMSCRHQKSSHRFFFLIWPISCCLFH